MADEAVAGRPRRRWLPALTLLLLAPVITEVLFGSTTLGTLFVLLPEIGTYGCVALLARAWVRRRGLGWLALLLLALAWAVAEEFLIIQTSVTPLIGVHPADTYGGRALGVSWVWMVFALVYESVWPLLVATQLAELLFPDRRAEPWIGRRGAIIAAVAFVPSAFVAWFGWTQSAEKQYFGHTFPPPRGWLLAAALVIIALVTAVALLRRPRPPHPADRDAPPAWLVGTVIGVLATARVAVSLFAYGAFPHVPVAATLAGAAVVAALALALIRFWSAGRGWTDRHRLALVSGALAG